MSAAAAHARGLPVRRPLRTRRLGALSIACYSVLGVALFFGVNWLYHAARKPTEFLAPVSTVLSKSPRATWATYGELFRQHSTPVVSAKFLAALAQVEGRGNPIARTYWRWQWSLNPFDLYRPASSAVGMFQITDGTFVEASRYCIHGNAVVNDGPWYDLSSCWFNSLYSRVVPSHAIEMTAAYLHQSVSDVLTKQRVSTATGAQRERVAAVIHLCGKLRADRFVQRGFRALPGERCGSHDLAGYLAKVERVKRDFDRHADS